MQIKLKKLYETYLNYRINKIEYEMYRLSLLARVRSLSVGAQGDPDPAFNRDMTERILKKLDKDFKALDEKKNSLATKLQFLQN